ncbi:uncharacterized protein JCM10292_007334 [Rhodotorula paludigena]|uniref:uncharacterized protein n=1 Tax=Rhodotorula paludigena TaxID=86838 RepID=UPI003180318A
MEDYPPPRRYSRGAYDHGGRPPPPQRGGGAYDDGAYDRRPPPPGRARDDYDMVDRRGPPRGAYDDAPGGAPPFDREFEGRSKRRRSLSPLDGPARGGPRRGSQDYPEHDPRDYRDGPPPPGRYRDDYYDRRGPPGPPVSRVPGSLPPPGYGAYPPPPPGYGEPLGGPPPPPLRPALEPPLAFPHRVTHAYFSDWFRSTNPSSLSDSADALEEAWKKYQGDFLRRELRGFFDANREQGGAWFEEKYRAEKGFADERRERRERVKRAERIEGWVQRAVQGELDQVSFDYDEARRKSRIQPNAATQAATAQPANGDSATNGESSASTEPAAAADEAVKSEEPGAGEAGKPASPEFVAQPARPEMLLVKGIPPQVGYKALEEVFSKFDGFVRMAMSEPNPYRGFNRIGWAIFTTSDAAKSALETIVAAAPKPAADKKEGDAVAADAGDAEGDKSTAEDPTDAGEEGAPAAAAHNGEHAAAQASEDAATNGADEPAAAVAATSSPYLLGFGSTLGHALDLSRRGTLLHLTEPRDVRIRAAPAACSAPARIAQDLERVERVVTEMERRVEDDAKKAKTAGDDAEMERVKGSEVIRRKREEWEKEVEERKAREELDDEAHQAAVAAVNKRVLDLSLSYLREAFDVCYYCCAVCESPEQLFETCARHVRRCDEVRNLNRMENEARWVEGFDAHVPLLTDVSTLDVRDLGAESREEETYRLTSPHLKQEEEGKFRCKSCNKLFSARKFVEKHLALKHTEIFGGKLEELEWFNNYALDPSRLPVQAFQTYNYLPSVLAPPPPSSSNPLRRNNRNKDGEDRPLSDRIGPPNKRSRRNDRNAEPGPPAPPPKGAALDPRAGRGATAYADLDGPSGGGADIVLPY